MRSFCRGRGCAGPARLAPGEERARTRWVHAASGRGGRARGARGSVARWAGAAALASLIAAPAAAGPPLVQLSGTAACVSETGHAGACADGVALDGAVSVVTSHDGRHTYAGTTSSDAVAVFDRDLSTGALVQKGGSAGCVSDDGTGGACADGVALNGVRSVALSPDGRNLYAAADAGDAVAIFDRNASTGVLTQKGALDACWSETGSLGACRDGVALDSPQAIVVSPDGRNAYVASFESSAVAVFDRNVSTGTLTQKAGEAACVAEIGSPGVCADGVALDGAFGIALSPDGRNVYVGAADSDAVVVLDRDLATGALTQKAGTAGCVSASGTGGACAIGVALDTAAAVAVSPDGRNVYVGGFDDDAVVVFDRDLATGALLQKAGTAGCVSETGTGGACADGVALDGATNVGLDPGGRSVYVASPFDADAVAVFTRDVREYDIDGDREVQALTDGLLLVRYAFGLTGAPLIASAVDLAECTRCTAPLIEAYIEAILGP